MPRFSARLHLLGLIAAVVAPVWLFAAYLLVQYAVNERTRFEQDAQQTARQSSLVVEGELANMVTVLEALSRSAAPAQGDLRKLHAEATRLVQGSDRTVLLRDPDGRQSFNTQVAFGTSLPPAAPLSTAERARLGAGRPSVSGVYRDTLSNDYRIAVSLPARGPNGEDWLLAITVPTSRIRDVLMPTVPDGWTLGVGDRDGSYVARSQLHEKMTGQPGLPEYVNKIVGREGTFTSRNFQGATLLAGYYRSDFSNWFYTANVPLSVVQAPLWQSLAAIGALAALAMLVSAALAYIVGKRIAGSARDLAARAEALGKGQPVASIPTSVSEFATIAEALVAAERAIAERRHELETVLETAPAAVWFTYDPQARQVIRNRFAAELMGLPTTIRTSFGAPDLVIDTIAVKDGHTVSREDRPLSRAMRGEQTDNEEFAYILPSGVERHLLSSARPIRDPANRIVGAVQISLDITERKRGEEQRKLLVNELSHRVKNTLAVVRSIASQTLRNAPSLTEAERALSSRLVSLAKAHDILTQENWNGADLKELIATSVAPHAELHRFQLSGKSAWLAPSLALSLALAIHELTTNAIKYGALSVAGGTVSIAWTVVRDGDARLLQITWSESGGPPVAAVERKGFGTRLLERIIDAESAGSVALTFEESGVVCVMNLNLGPALETSGPA